MTFDGLTLAALAEELNARLAGGRVQKIVQPDPLSVALQVYANHERVWLLLSADPQRPRAYLTAGRPGRGVESPSPLLLLLRKHVQGRRLGAIRQPPGERIIWIDVDAYEGDGPDAVSVPGYRLIIEAISQYSNLILVGANGLVLDAARRVSAEQNRSRVTWPRQPYVPPPPQSKRGLSEITPEVLRAALDRAEAGAAVWQTLVGAFAGLGPLAGREAAFRALGEARAKVPAEEPARQDAAERLADALHAIVGPVRAGTFTPSVAKDGEDVIAFAPYPITHLGSWESRPSLSAAADEFYDQASSVRAVDLARRDLLAAIAADRGIVEKKRQSLLRALEGTSKADELRAQGELILTYATAIPRGAARFRANGVELELDPRETAVENAQARFRRYRKARAALREVPTILAETELRLRYLDEIAALADLAETADEVRALRPEIRLKRERSGAPPKQTGRKRPARQREPSILRQRTSGGQELLVGRTARQNQYVTFELARPDDIWLHAHGVPGAHVILRVDGPPPRAALEEAAAVAARYSANRAAGKVLVDWTPKKYVRPLAKGTPGLVTYANEQTILTAPAREGGGEEAL